jgi:anhydro-N-acetylmuramic acid kinase
MIVAGVMSGTSADGINVALVRIGGTHLRGRVARSHTSPSPKIELLGHAEFPYPPKVRIAILAAMNAKQARVADLARLNFLLGDLYADAVLDTQRRFRVKADLVGCHGQTLYHQGELQPYLGRKISTTWQTGEAAMIAARVGVPIVSDFRPADMAAGGRGAPLVSYLDYLLFRDAKVGRIVQNIGGIANLTAIPPGAAPRQVIAFDTGPGNMVIDAVTEALFERRFDRGGKIAASGQIIEPVIKGILTREFFRQRPPKTAGREEFGREFVRDFLRQCGRARKEDVVATATALTARSIAGALQRFVLRKSARKALFREMIVSGGGTKNHTLITMLTESLASTDIRIRSSDDLGLPSEAKEAVAFAVLAYETRHHRPSNVPSATGAKRPAVLGKISYA